MFHAGICQDMDPSKITSSDNVLPFSTERDKHRADKLNLLIEDIKVALQQLLDTGEETIIGDDE